jgi:hypothetical protein
MKSLAVVILAAVAVLAGCVASATRSAAPSDGSPYATKAEVDAMKASMQDMRADMQKLRVDLIGLQDQIRTNARGGVDTPSGAATPEKPTNEWFDRVAQVSDVVRVWAGQMYGVAFFVCPYTKDEETLKLFRDQLGDEYAYMGLTIVNPAKSGQKYLFDPKQARFKLEFESAQPGGPPIYVVSFDPREIIKVRKEQLGGISLEEYFQGKELMPGESYDTYILFPKSVDFSKVKALWMNSSKIPEVKQ